MPDPKETGQPEAEKDPWNPDLPVVGQLCECIGAVDTLVTARDKLRKQVTAASEAGIQFAEIKKIHPDAWAAIEDLQQLSRNGRAIGDISRITGHMDLVAYCIERVFAARGRQNT
ncbi:hypothetical protein KKC44_05475 [Patescibacteria group bacterium]|nr:hypothetical protein [Patescibacteria group bacterium]MBU2260024.1 hypothetical protein [Patescibacteria group bacterium]